MKLIIEMQGSKIVMIDESTKETAILDNKKHAVSNFASWIYAGHLSGKPTTTKDNVDFSRFVKDWVSIEGDNSHSFDLNKSRDVTERGGAKREL